jgi:hypothetical protein
MVAGRSIRSSARWRHGPCLVAHGQDCDRSRVGARVRRSGNAFKHRPMRLSGGYHPPIQLAVAYSAIFIATGQEQHGDGGPTSKDAKGGFRDRSTLPPATVAVAKHGAKKMAREGHHLVGAISCYAIFLRTGKTRSDVPIFAPSLLRPSWAARLAQIEAAFRGRARVPPGVVLGWVFRDYIFCRGARPSRGE